MHPVLFHIGGFAVPTFGVLVLTGIFIGIFLQKREAARLGYDPRKVEELALITILLSFAGARGMYVLQNLDATARDPRGIFSSGGYVLYGGLAAGVPAAILLARRAGIPGARLVDIFSPGVTLGFGFGRIGCTFAGCDYGLEAAAPSWYTLVFTDPASLVPPELRGVPLLPSQPLMALSHFAVFALIYALRGRLTPWPGAVLFLALATEPPLRFLCELTRGDVDRGFLGPFSTSQWIALVLTPLAIVAFAVRIRGRSTAAPLRSAATR